MLRNARQPYYVAEIPGNIMSPREPTERDMSDASKAYPEFMANRMETEQPKGAVPKPDGIIFVARSYRFAAPTARRFTDGFKEEFVCRRSWDRQVATAQCLQRLRNAVIRVLHTGDHTIFQVRPAHHIPEGIHRAAAPAAHIRRAPGTIVGT